MNQYKKIGIALFIVSILSIPSIHIHAETTHDNMYYILVDRYVNGDSANDITIDIDDATSYHGGDIKGVIDKVQELKQLGITSINLSPIMEAESYHGFDTMQYAKMDEQFGNVTDLKQLVDEAHELEMKVILDISLAYVHPDHPYHDDEEISLFGTTVSSLRTTEEAKDHVIQSMQYWIDHAGVDGFHVYINEQQQALFESIKEQLGNTTGLIVDHVDKETSQMNHAFQKKAVDILKKPGNKLTDLIKEQTTESNQIYYLESVFTNRFAFETMKEGYHPVTRWKLATTLLYTLNGSSFLYQGIEVPMDNGVAEPDHRMAELNKADEEITKHVEKLSAIKANSDALKNGDIEIVGEDGAMIVYKRETTSETMYIAINNDEETRVVPLTLNNNEIQLKGTLDDDIVRSQEDGTHRIVLDRESSNIFIVEKDTGLNWLFISMMILIFGGFIGFIIAYNYKVKKANAS